MIKVTESESLSNDSTSSIYTGVRVNLQGDNFSLRADVPTDKGLLEEYGDFMENLYATYQENAKKIRAEYREMENREIASFKESLDEIGKAAETAVLAAVRKYMMTSRENFEEFKKKYEKGEKS